MELYNTKNVDVDVERIKAKIEEFFAPRVKNGTVQWYKIQAGYNNANHFWGTCEYLPTKDGARFGPITAHYTILILDGEIRFQN